MESNRIVYVTESASQLNRLAMNNDFISALFIIIISPYLMYYFIHMRRDRANEERNKKKPGLNSIQIIGQAIFSSHFIHIHLFTVQMNASTVHTNRSFLKRAK